ncbi:cation:proton antiporter [Candidatus Woesearchaeota archaeon]|nr:MAG: cation:proton antiporter [Candidatus Woesearchaeota archaeon]
MNIFLFLAGLFFLTLALGRVLERFNIPWIFSALFLGFGAAVYNPFSSITQGPVFDFLATLGIYFLLFIIGFEMDFKRIAQSGTFIFKTAMGIILAEGILGSILVHYVFGTPWMISFLVGISFATVGEAVLLPILQRFNIINTSLGRMIIGVGVLDDLIEIITIIALSVLIGNAQGHTSAKITTLLLVFTVMFTLAYLLTFLRKEARKDLKHFSQPTIFLLSLFIIFVFVGIGSYADAAALGALLAGIALKNFLPAQKQKTIDKTINAVAYGLFAPVFFFAVGLETDIAFLLASPLLVFGVILFVNVVKILASWAFTKNELGSQQSIILGIALTVKFSTSIVIIKMLFDQGLIDSALYSVLIASTAIFKFIVPTLMSQLITRWSIAKT